MHVHTQRNHDHMSIFEFAGIAVTNAKDRGQFQRGSAAARRLRALKSPFATASVKRVVN